MNDNNVDTDYEEYQSNVQQYADTLHDYFKHLNHNYQDGGYSHNFQDGGYSTDFYPSSGQSMIGRSDNSLSSPSGQSMFAGDIGDTPDIIKRDSNSKDEPESESIPATVTKIQ